VILAKTKPKLKLLSVALACLVVVERYLAVAIGWGSVAASAIEDVSGSSR